MRYYNIYIVRCWKSDTVEVVAGVGYCEQGHAVEAILPDMIGCRLFLGIHLSLDRERIMDEQCDELTAMLDQDHLKGSIGA